MKPNMTLFALLISFIFLSCEVTETNIQIIENDLEIESVEGRIELTSVNSNPDFSNLDVFSFYEDDDVEAGNTFDIDVTKDDEHPQIVFVENENDDIVMAGIVRQGDTEIVINELSTAKAMVLRNLIFLGRTAQEKEMILDYAEDVPTFQSLLLAVTHAIQTDLDNVYNEEVFPELDELSTEVALEIHEKLMQSELFKGTAINGIGSEAPAITIKETDKRFVTFSNHNLVYLCGQATDMFNDSKENVFTIGRRHSLIKWIPPGISDDVETDTKFNIYGTSYLVDVTKGFQANTDIFFPTTANGRASMMNIMVAVREAMKLWGGTAGNIVLGVDVIQLVYVVNKPLIDPLVSEFQSLWASGNKSGAMKPLLKIGGIILTEGLASGAIVIAAAKLGWIDKIKGLIKDLANVIPVIKGALVAKQLAAETIPYVTDLIGGDREYRYYIRTITDIDGGERVYNAHLIDKGTLVPPYLHINVNNPEYRGEIPLLRKITFSGFSIDGRNQRVKYVIKKYKGSLMALALKDTPGNELDPIDVYDSGYVHRNGTFQYDADLPQDGMYLFEIYVENESGLKSKVIEEWVWRIL